MQGAKRRITVGGRSDPNPLPPTDENIHAGQRNFGAYCMVCHGLDGQNTGVPFADKMAPPVPLLNSAGVQSYTDGQLHWIIQNGIFPSGMPASKDMFRDEEIWQMVLFTFVICRRKEAWESHRFTAVIRKRSSKTNKI